MEKNTYDHFQQAPAEVLLNSIQPHHMLQFIPGGYRLMEYDGVPIVIAVSSKLETLVQTSGYIDDFYGDKVAEQGAPTAELRDWQDSLLSASDIRQMAIKELQRLETEGDNALMDCYNCDGEVSFEISCQCTFDDVDFLKPSDIDGALGSAEYVEGSADPDCMSCCGMGKILNNCPSCHGDGTMSKYPVIVLTDEESVSRTVVTLDLLRLIASGDISVSEDSWHNAYEDGFVIAGRTISFEVGNYIEREIIDMGIDIKNVGIVEDGRIDSLALRAISIVGYQSEFRQNGPVVYEDYSHSDTPDTPSSVLEAAQSSIVRHYAPASGSTNYSDDGIAAAKEWVIRPLRSFEESLSDLQVAASAKGYTVGYTQSVIATGEVGPTFYLLDEAGNPVIELSKDHNVRSALETAWLTLQRIKLD